MLRMLALTIAVTAFAAGVAFAQPPAEAKADVKEGAAMTSPSAAAVAPRMMRQGFNWEEAYKAAGASEEQLKKLKDLDEQIKAARQGNDIEKAKNLGKEKRQVLTDEQNAKLREHFRSMAAARRGRGFAAAPETSAPKTEKTEAKEPEKKSE